MALKELPFRGSVPARSNPPKSKSYRSYKSHLRADFRKRCGYCDGPDVYVGGEGGSHIDHFAPKSKFPALENRYENLVYACPFCNRAKSNKWVGDDPGVPNDGQSGFVDPCSTELDQHLGRSDQGKIVGLTRLGRYLVENLGLRLARHQLVWQLGRMGVLAEELEELRHQLPLNSDVRVAVLEQLAEVFAEYMRYLRAFQEL